MRRWQSRTDTAGQLSLGGVILAYTLEDALRPPGVKTQDRTCIAAGEYELRLTVSGRATVGTLWSPDPDHRLPELLDVPMFSAVRMHALNTDAETKGCIGVGLDLNVGGVLGLPVGTRFPDIALSRSRPALVALLPLIVEPCRILIVNGPDLVPIEEEAT